MDGARRELLPRTALAGDEHVPDGFRGVGEIVAQRPSRRRLPENPIRIHVTECHLHAGVPQCGHAWLTVRAKKEHAALESKRRLMGTAHVPTQLIVEMAATADEHGTRLGMAFDSAKARDALAYAESFEAVATKAEAFAQRVRDAILVTKADTGAATLAAYATLKGVVRLPQGAGLRDSFDKMTQLMKRGRRPVAAAPVIAPAGAQPAAPPAVAAVQPAKAA